MTKQGRSKNNQKHKRIEDELARTESSVDSKYTAGMNALCGDSGTWGGAKQLREMDNTWG